jgi:glycine/D-amino acid oxidase-like deaminating enzyme
MTQTSAEVVICGAGIAGIAAAYNLAVKQGVRNILLVDERPPLSLTSDKSTECYRNWWPGPGDAMVALMNRGADLLEGFAYATDNRIRLNRRGYLFCTAEEARIATFRQVAEEAERLGAGAKREHTGAAGEPQYLPSPPEGFENMPRGADLILDQTLIRRHFPYLTHDTLAVVHARRAGWFSGQQLGMLLLDAAREHGVRLEQTRLTGVEVAGGKLRGVTLQNGTTQRVATDSFVNAAGPAFKAVGRLAGLELPVNCELHMKVSFGDTRGVIGRDAPLVIWTDPTPLVWSEDERAELAESDETRPLLDMFPPGVHFRPDGPADSPIVLALWTFDTEPREPVFPFHYDESHGEITLRGLSSVIPGLRAYLDRGLKTYIDGGYYTRTLENRPLVGPTPVEGYYVMGAFGGFGLMASPPAGELLAAHMTGGPLPHYAPAFLLARYDDPAYQQLLASWGESGQL